MISGKRLKAIMKKEFLHILHDPKTLFIIFLMPVAQLIIFGYAMNTEIQEIKMGIIDYNQTPMSDNLTKEFTGSKFFTMVPELEEEAQIDGFFKSSKAKAVLIIPQDFAKDLNKGSATVQFIIDAADPNAAQAIRNYFTAVISNYNQKYGTNLQMPFGVEAAIWFNPNLKSAYFFIPGLLAMILVMVSALLTSITVTREKELGTMEQMLVSPVKPFEIIFGKLIPYVFLAFGDAFLILLVGLLLFKVPFIGSFVLFLFLTTLYIITALSLGLMISTVAKSQQTAMMMAITITMLPTIILSGFIFPLNSMPKLLQWISYIVPAKYYLIIVRGIMLKGCVFTQMLLPTGVLALMSFMLFVNSTRRFSLTLEK